MRRPPYSTRTVMLFPTWPLCRTVKGRSEPERIDGLLGKPPPADETILTRLTAKHADLLTAYRDQRWDEALALVGVCRETGGGFGLDELYATYEERSRGFVATPPLPDWDGVHVSTSK